MTKCNFGKFKHKCDIHKIGSSSYKMHNSEMLLREFNLKKGDNVLDLGSGPGDYSIEISKLIGNEGQVISIDKDKDVIEYLNERIIKNNIQNIKTFVANIKEKIPLKDNSIDICVIITVLHTLNIKKIGNDFFSEVKRVLKPNGHLITIDVKKKDMGFGPPLNMRISSDELEEIVEFVGFKKERFVDLNYNYMMEFRINK